MPADNGVSSLAKIVFPIVGTALLSMMAFLIVQNMQLKDEVAEIKLEELQRYSDVCQEIALLKLIGKNVGAKVDRVLLIQAGGGG